MIRLGVLFGLAVSWAIAQTQTPPKTHLKVGDVAPDFTIAANRNTANKEIKLADYKGKKTLVLAFFPAAFTGG